MDIISMMSLGRGVEGLVTTRRLDTLVKLVLCIGITLAFLAPAEGSLY